MRGGRKEIDNKAQLEESIKSSHSKFSSKNENVCSYYQVTLLTSETGGFNSSIDVTMVKKLKPLFCHAQVFTTHLKKLKGQIMITRLQ